MNITVPVYTKYAKDREKRRQMDWGKSATQRFYQHQMVAALTKNLISIWIREADGKIYATAEMGSKNNSQSIRMIMCVFIWAIRLLKDIM